MKKPRRFQLCPPVNSASCRGFTTAIFCLLHDPCRLCAILWVPAICSDKAAVSTCSCQAIVASKNTRRLFYPCIYCPVLCVTCTAASREAVCLLASEFKPRFVKPAAINPAVQGCIQFFPRSFECTIPKLP